MKRGIEQYALNVGLMRKTFKDITFNNGDSTIVDEGQELYQTYRSHGLE